jgi:hypothetical protein
MRALLPLLLVWGCAKPPDAVRQRDPIPYELTVCPGSTVTPVPLPKLRNVEMVAAHDAATRRALAASERSRAACAETLRRLVEWVETAP